MLKKISAIAFCSFTFLATSAQKTKQVETCDGACCKKETKTSVKPVSTVLFDTEKKKEIKCKLTSPELRKRKEEVINVLKKNVLEKEELPQGYRYKFEATDEILDQLTVFIKSERACCDFFDFTLAVSDRIVWMSITGSDEAKNFIKAELDF